MNKLNFRLSNWIFMYVSTFLLNRIMPTRSLININEFSVTEDIRNKPLIACLYSKLYYSISNIGKLNQLQEKGIRFHYVGCLVIKFNRKNWLGGHYMLKKRLERKLKELSRYRLLELLQNGGTIIYQNWSHYTAHSN